MFRKLLLILCLGVTSAVFYGCTQPQKAGDEGAVVEEPATPTEAPAATPMDDSGMNDTGDAGGN